MSWKCESCGQRLSGKENFCPNCATKTVYRCVSCDKELDNGKRKYCPVCHIKRTEKRNEEFKKIGGGVAAAGSLAVFVVTGGKFGGKKT